MKRIGIISDTHSYWDDLYAAFFNGCDEIWHAGDIGSYEIMERLSRIAALRAVYGNCDGQDVRRVTTEIYRFKVEEANIMLKHIGGSPNHYHHSVREQLLIETPDLFVCGHSHILKVMHDKTLNMLFINPGAAGIQGWQNVRTLVRLEIEGKSFKNLEVYEIKS
jgi:putative phosphoesterase